MIPMMIIISTILFLGIALLLLTFWMRKRIGIPMGNVIYSDSVKEPGTILTAKNIPLSGRPDFLLKTDGQVIPVELKRGKTPASPYPSHLAQLFAYCYLVKDNYAHRPEYGIIDYPENDFKLEFPKEAEENVEKLVREIVAKKQGTLNRANLSNICRSCRLEHLS